jgi:hypothetical protein
VEIIHFATSHAFDGFVYLLLIGSLLLTAFEVFHLVKAHQISNLLTITRDHREIWSQVYFRPELARVLQRNLDLQLNPVSDAEALFVTFIILHLKASHKANIKKMLVTPEAIEKDVSWFFSLPIPLAVWQSSKEFQDEDFRRFVESALFASPEK